MSLGGDLAGPGGDPSAIDPDDGSPFGRPRRTPRTVVVALLSIAFAAMIVSVLVMAIWPGSFALFAPLLCSGETPDAFVVVDRYQVVPGETTFNFTMYCVGARGEVDEIGFIRPFLLMMVTVTVVFLALALVLRGLSSRTPEEIGVR